MGNRDAWDDNGEDLPAELVQVRQLVAAEIHRQLAMRHDLIQLPDVTEVAYAVAERLGQAFRIEWAPVWEQDRSDDDESLGPDGAAFYGSRLAQSDRYPIFDHDWPARQ
ncbi:hypothetical protein [Fodinicola feengrottensis]|uniref:Uncharacterized protein n=1 Tax=Fodinicola feengrottensis TaxID=435914 RepID=A0ABP4SYF5_9ACTN|nr:hypothetical protein [Fodinicola feengrottensis]